MKNIIRILIIMGLSNSVKAQDIMIAPEVGGTYQTMIQKVNGYVYENKYQLGLKVGANVDIGFNTNFSLQTGAFLSMKNGTESYHERQYALGSGLPVSDKDRRVYNLTYIQVPVYALYKTGKEFDDPHFFVGAGPYIGAVLRGRFQQEYTNTLNGEDITKRYDDAISVGTEKKDKVRLLDLGVQATLGYEFPFGLYFRGFYGIGLLNVAPDANKDNQLRNHGGGISVGYFFELTHKNIWER